MVILIAGASHTGKTRLAQKLLEQYHYPYLSIDHLKMGLIRSDNTNLTVYDDDKLTAYLWPIVREMMKTVIENGQNLIVEGCYIPFDWKESFGDKYLSQIHYCCLIMSDEYIETHFDEILRHACDVEQRLDCGGPVKQELLEDNRRNLAGCREHGISYILLGESYDVMDKIGGVLWPT